MTRARRACQSLALVCSCTSWASVSALQIAVAAGPRLGPATRFGAMRKIRPVSLCSDVLAADVAVVPVEHVERAVGTDLEAEADPLRVVGDDEIVAVVRGESRSLAHEHIREDGVLVDVGHEDAAGLRRRKGVRLVDARAAVRRTVPVVGDGLDVAVDVGIEVLAALAMIDAAGDHVQESAG